MRQGGHILRYILPSTCPVLAIPLIYKQSRLLPRVSNTANDAVNVGRPCPMQVHEGRKDSSILLIIMQGKNKSGEGGGNNNVSPV